MSLTGSGRLPKARNGGIDAKALSDALKVFHPEGALVEIRAMKGKSVWSGYFNDADQIVAEVCKWDRSVTFERVGFTINPIDQALLGRAPNQLVANPSSATSDKNVLRLSWLMIDVDPVRPSGVSSSDEELQAAESAAAELFEFLRECWGEGVLACSGNGMHLFYPIDLPNDDQSKSLLKAVLAALAEWQRRQPLPTGAAAVQIDCETYKPAQLGKLFGTVARKGREVPEQARRHRLAEMRFVPDGELRPVPLEKLQAIAALSSPPSRIPSSNGHTAPNAARRSVSKTLMLERYLRDYGVPIFGEKSFGDGRLAFLIRCPFDESHGKSGETFVAQDPTGRLSAQCKHDSCSGRGWRQFKEAIGTPLPDHYDATHSTSPLIGEPNASPVPATRRALVTRCAADITPETITWLWPVVVPLAKLTVFQGDPGVGKSFVTLDIAARVSRGGSLPGSATANPPGRALILSAEDDAADTIVPRLKSAGADLSRIHVIDGVRRGTDEIPRMFSLESDLIELERMLTEYGDVQLLIVDPILAFCGSSIDTHKTSDIRRMLTPLTHLAARTGIAVIVINHLTKATGGKAVYRANGSLAISAAARAVWHFGRDGAGDRRLMVPVKCNLSADQNGFAFTIHDQCVAWEADPVQMTADELLADEMRDAERDADASEQASEAETWLRGILAGGAVETKEVDARASKDGIRSPALRTARRKLKTKFRREGFGPGSKYFLELPDST